MALARLMKNTTWIEEGGVPVVHPPRRVPFALSSAKKSLLKDELRKLQEMDIIAQITGPTPWVSSMVTVKKPNGQLRICLGPKDLIRVMKSSHYPLPMMEELLPQLTKAKVFSTFDIKNGFWHIQLVEASSKLTTFNTPFGDTDGFTCHSGCLLRWKSSKDKGEIITVSPTFHWKKPQ